MKLWYKIDQLGHTIHEDGNIPGYRIMIYPYIVFLIWSKKDLNE